MSNKILNRIKSVFIVFFVSIIALIFVLGIPISGVWGGCALYKKYKVWSYAKDGEAELARADWNRQIAVREALAKSDAAKNLAQAEIIRARGVAQANKIIGQSLEHNEAYLRYLYINNLENTKNQVIYIPTEGALPILEAGKRNKK